MHSQEPWRHTLQKRDNLARKNCTSLSACSCMHIGFSPGVAVLRDSGSWREMSAHVHTGTLRYLHTAIAVQNFTHWKTNTHHVTMTSNRETDRERGMYWVGGYQDMYSHPHTLHCRPPGCWDYGRLSSRTWCIHCIASQWDTWGLNTQTHTFRLLR